MNAASRQTARPSPHDLAEPVLRGHTQLRARRLPRRPRHRPSVRRRRPPGISPDEVHGSAVHRLFARWRAPRNGAITMIHTVPERRLVHPEHTLSAETPHLAGLLPRLGPSHPG
jgi:hypothetical protein